MPSPSLTANQSEIAELLGVSAKTVQQWDRDGLREAARLGMDGREARYDVRAAVHWWHDREMDALREETKVDAKEAAQIRNLEAQAESRELDLEVKRGELVPIDEVEGLVRESLESVDSVLRHAASRFAPQLAKAAKVPLKQARSILREVVESVRGAIREGGAHAD